MNEKLILNKSTLVNIADAVRSKEGSEDAIKVSDIASKILALTVGGSSPDSYECYIDIGEYIPLTTSSIFEQFTDVEVVHGIVFVRMNNSKSWTNGEFAILVGLVEGGYSTNDTCYYGAAVRNNWSNVSSASAASSPITFDDGLIQFDASTNNFSVLNNFVAGNTYKYIIF